VFESRSPTPSPRQPFPAPLLFDDPRLLLPPRARLVMMPAPSPSVDEVARLADGLVKLRNINPVALAVWKGDAQLLEELLERLGDGPTRNSNEAGENNSVEPGSVASWDRMVDPSKGDLSSGDTALQLAFRLGNLRAAMRLLDAGALVNARGRGPHQFAPVQHALYFTSAKMLENNPGVQDALAFADEESFTQGKPLMARPAYANDPKAAPLPLPTRRALNLGEHVARRCIMLTNERAKEKWLTDKQPRLSKALRDLPDFAFALKFNVRSWIPLLGRVLPKDTCHVWKVGSRSVCAVWWMLPFIVVVVVVVVDVGTTCDVCLVPCGIMVHQLTGCGVVWCGVVCCFGLPAPPVCSLLLLVLQDSTGLHLGRLRVVELEAWPPVVHLLW